MKKISLLLMLCIFTTTGLLAQPPKIAATKGSHFGETVKADGALSPDVLPGMLKEKESADVLVKGKVMNVCKARGCFFYLKTSTGKIYIKTKDDAFFVPLALNGKTIVVKGIAEKDKDSKEISIQATGILVM